MILKSGRIFILSAFLISLVSCYGSWNIFYKDNDVDERTENITYLSSDDEAFAQSGVGSLQGEYTVLVFSDTHFGNTKKKVECDRLYNWLAEKQGRADFPSFALSLGDVVDLGRQEQYDEYLAFCHKLQNDYGISLIFNSCGNHDIYQNNWDNWEKNCYPYTSFYKFQTEKLSWYCLDTASGTFGLGQYNKLNADFKNDSRMKIIFTHYPFVEFNKNCANMAETTERNKMISDFAKNDVICVLGGHIHRSTSDYLGFNEYTIESFAYAGGWGLLHVDEEAGTAELEFIK